MEKKVNNIYNLSCNWYMPELHEENYSLPMFISGEWIENEDGMIHNSFSGKFVSFEDNTLLGYAVDEKKSKINQIIIGTIIEGKGVTFCKIYDDDFISNPTYYHVFANSLANNMGLTDSYYGEFFSRGLLPDFKRLGLTSVQAKKLTRDEAEIKRIIEVYNKMYEHIKGSEIIGGLALDTIEGLNPEETTKLISDFADEMLHADLPVVLQQEVCTAQPGNQ